MWRKFQNFILSGYASNITEQEYKRLNVIIIFCCLLSSFCLFLLPFLSQIVEEEMVSSQRIDLLIYIFIYLSMIFLIRVIKSVSLISLIFVSSIFIIITWNNYILGGNLSLTFMWYFLCALTGIYLLGAKMGLFFSFLAILSTFLFNYLQDINILNYIIKIDDEILFRNKLVFTFCFLQLLITVIIILYENVNKKYVEVIRLKEEEVSETKLRKEAIINGQEKERGRISKELHDGLAQMIVVANMRMENLKDSICDDKIKEFQGIQKFLTQILDETRLISQNLKPFILDDLGLKVSIIQLIETSFKNSDIKCKYVIHDCVNNVGFYEGIALFRIIQEAFSNILKYSQADFVHLFIEKENDRLIIKIKDNGVGALMSTVISKSLEGSSGIQNMEDRVKFLNGEFEFFTKKNEGFLIKIKMPCYDGE